MGLSEDSPRGSTTSKSAAEKSRNGRGKAIKRSSEPEKKSVIAERIEQFCAVTESTEDVARNLLEACGGNLEMAINMHMEGVSGQSVAGQSDDFVRAPIPQKQEILVQDGYEGYAFGLKGKRKIKSVLDTFRNFEAETKLHESRLLMDPNGGTSASSSVPEKRTLEDLYRPPIDLMFKGNVQNARDAGVAAKKWLIVNVHNVSEFSCQVLNRDVWSNTSVREIIRDHFIFLQLYMDSGEGQRYMTFYKVNQWPYVAILDPRTGEMMAEWCQTDSSTYVNLMVDFVAANPWDGDSANGHSRPPDSKRRRTENILDASEDGHIQVAIRASLQAEKDSTPSVSVSDGDEPEEWSDSESESRDSNSMVGTSKEASPSKESVEELTKNDSQRDWKTHLGLDSDPASSIVIRYPDGTKERLSLPCTSTILALLDYVHNKGFPGDNYELMANFPKRRLLTMEATTTFKEAGLFPQDTIFVQSK